MFFWVTHRLKLIGEGYWSHLTLSLLPVAMTVQLALRNKLP